jgi:hypothetical protein
MEATVTSTPRTLRLRLSFVVAVLLLGSPVVNARPAIGVPAAGETPVTTAAPPADVNDEILRWTYYLLDVFRQDGGPTSTSRAAAMMYGAAYDAVNSITPIGQPYLRRSSEGSRCAAMPSVQLQQCLDAAVAWAAASALGHAFPGQASLVQNARNAEDQRIGTGLAVDIGRAVGNQVAADMTSRATNDGSTNNSPYPQDTTPGAWRPTGNGCTTAFAPNWGAVRPFVLTGGSQFRPPPPGGFASYPALLASGLYAQNLNEVQSLGRFNSTTRTAAQTQTAFFWANDVAGTYLPPGQHLDHTMTVARQRGLTPQQNARLFGLVSFALADAAIAAWDAKYRTPTDLWRPETAIELAGTDNNPATNPDASWDPLSVLPDGRRFNPCFPAYISGHATLSSAWAAVMRLFFGTDNIAFTGTTDDPNARGVTRQFPSFSSAAREDGRSRIYLGVHFQFDADAGFSTGTAVGEFVFGNALRAL